jgi:NAD(P)-dependent dehydrogenase (short-subunit alcohol dehydrogenase family)
MHITFEGLRVLVTGSTRGIGSEIATQFAASGAAVTVHGRRDADAQARAERLRRDHPHTLVGWAAGDLASAAGCEAVLAACPDVDVLVHNAGVYEWCDVLDCDDARWQRMLDTNLLSGARLARHHLRRMLERGWGRIVFIASDSGLNIPVDMVHYGVSKAAELALMRGLAERTAGTGVTVNAVLPGPTRTGAEGAFFDDYAARVQVPRDEAEAHFVAAVRPTSLLRRMAHAGEVASMVLYAASRQASATNGAALRAEGGILRHVG